MPKVDKDGFYHRYNSGFALDAYRSLNPEETPLLRGLEKKIAAEINRRLRKGSKPVVLVELGGQVAGSSAVLAEKFKDEINEGSVRIIVTNKERTGIDRLLASTEKRLKERQDGTVILPDQNTVQFVRERKGLIQWKNGVVTETLPKVMKREGGADIITETIGGLFHAEDLKTAAAAVTKALKPKGVLFTLETLHDPASGIHKLPKDLKPEQQYKWGVGGYRKYTKE